MYSNSKNVYYNPYYSQNYLYRGPLPVIPFLLVVCLGLLVCWETMQEYCEMLFEVKESIEQSETLALTLAVIILVALLSCGFTGDTVFVVVPIATLLLVLLLQNEVLFVLVLLLVVSVFAMYSYPSQTGESHQYGWNPNWSRPVYQSRLYYQLNNVEISERISDLPFSLTLGQICYLIMVGCLMACTMYSEDQNIWWTCMALLFACVLCVHFSGRSNR